MCEEREAFWNEWENTLNLRMREMTEIAHEALQILGECDTDNPHVEVWCINHQEKRCSVPQLRERYAKATGALR